MAQSIRDLEWICQLSTEAHPWLEDPNVIMKEWKPRPNFYRKLRIGVMEFDGVVMPHPPIIRALRIATALLREAGHDGASSAIFRLGILVNAFPVIEFEPYASQKAWDVAVWEAVHEKSYL